jgi:hypothetical protein
MVKRGVARKKKRKREREDEEVGMATASVSSSRGLWWRVITLERDCCALSRGN